MQPRILALAALLMTALNLSAAELRVPAFTAYLDPDARGASISERAGVSRWTSPALKVLWFGEIKTPGKLDCSLALRLPEGKTSKLRLTVADQSRESTAEGAGENRVVVRFGTFDVPQAGYFRFTLESNVSLMSSNTR